MSDRIKADDTLDSKIVFKALEAVASASSIVRSEWNLIVKSQRFSGILSSGWDILQMLLQVCFDLFLEFYLLNPLSQLDKDSWIDSQRPL